MGCVQSNETVHMVILAMCNGIVLEWVLNPFNDGNGNDTKVCRCRTHCEVSLKKEVLLYMVLIVKIRYKYVMNKWSYHCKSTKQSKRLVQAHVYTERTRMRKLCHFQMGSYEIHNAIRVEHQQK